MDKRDRQLFILPSEIWDAVTKEDVKSTTDDMIEMDIFFPPVKYFDIHTMITPRKIVDWFYENKIPMKVEDPDQSFSYRVRYDFDDDMVHYSWLWGIEYDNKFTYMTLDDPRFLKAAKSRSIESGMPFENYMDNMEAQLRTVQQMLFVTLVTALVAKNATKEVQQIKKYGAKSRKKPKQYSYITTIKIGKISETNRLQEGSGSTVRPHLRRGHIRNQHFGEGNKEIKKIFIQPVFVNADEGWIENQRKAYVVKAA